MRAISTEPATFPGREAGARIPANQVRRNAQLVVLSMVLLFLLPAFANGQTGKTKGGRTARQANTADTTNGSGSFTRCVEQMDVAACERARKHALTPQQKSLVLAYEFDAGRCQDKALLEQALRLDAQNAFAHFLKAWCGPATPQEGVDAYRKAIELKPEWKRYYVEAALVAGNDEHYKSTGEELKLWKLALESATDDPRVYTGYGRALLSRGKDAEAEAMFQKGVAANPDDSDALSALCSLYISQKNKAKLRAVCTATIERSSAQLDTLAYQLNGAEEYSLAEAAFRKALKTGPDPQGILNFNLASTLLQEGRVAEAVEIYRQYTLKRPGDAMYVSAYASALERSGDVKSAEAQYLRAAEHNDCSTLSDLARFHLNQKRVHEAFQELDRAFQDQWDCSPAVYMLTNNTQAFGAEQRELPQFEGKILRRARPNPDEKTANTWYRFGVLAHAFSHNDEAAVAYRKAADLDPGQAFPLGGLGWALTDAGRYPEAIAAFEEAEKRKPGYLKSAPEVQKQYDKALAAATGKKP